jgi:hypothetical protein
LTVPVAAGTYCRNCDLFLGEKPGNFCPNCGQDTHTHPPSFGEFLHEFVTHYIALEGRLTRTLGLLFLRPGELTIRYFAGRKNRYVLPLRLYITASLLFFILVKFFGAGSLVKHDNDSEQAAAKDPALLWQSKTGTFKVRPAVPASMKAPDRSQDANAQPFLDIVICDPSPSLCTTFRERLKDRYGTQTVDQVWQQVRDKVIALAPYAMFLMLPLFALITKLLYFTRGRPYGEHVVYALHVHAFAFFLLLAVALVSEAATGWLMLGGALYFWLAMRRVFGGRWWATSARFAAIGMLYPALLFLAILFTLILALIF